MSNCTEVASSGWLGEPLDGVLLAMSRAILAN
jgi:hypothetical protein